MTRYKLIVRNNLSTVPSGLALATVTSVNINWAIICGIYNLPEVTQLAYPSYVVTLSDSQEVKQGDLEKVSLGKATYFVLPPFQS